MYIRVRKNKSGSSSVYLLLSVRTSPGKNPTAKVIKSFGSTSDPHHLKILISQAKKLKAYLGNEPLSHVGSAFAHSNDDISDSSISKLGISAFYSQIFKSLFPSLLPAKDLKTLSDLVIMRIDSPASKLKSADSSKGFFNVDLNINQIYRLMDKLDDSVIKKIKMAVLKNTTACLGHISVMFYDITTIHFENNSQSDLKEFGFSKDGKHQHVQISLALIVSDKGLPVGYEIFKGNIFEGATLIPTLKKLKEEYGVKDVTVVADSAMLSKTNTNVLAAENFKYIISSKIRNLSAKLTKQVVDQNGYSLSDDLKYKEIQLDENKRLISAFSKTRKLKDQKDRKKALDKLEDLIGQNPKTAFKGSLKKLFVKVNKDSTIQLDQEKIEKSKQLDGYFGFITNTDLSSQEIINNYRGLWQVEQSFRITKHNLKVRPVYHHKDSRIKAHFAICYMAFAIIRHVEFHLKKANIYVPLEKLNKYLNDINEIKIESNGISSSIATKIPKEIGLIFKALNIKSPQEFMKKAQKQEVNF